VTTLVGLHIEGRGTWIASDQMISGDGLKSGGPMPKWVLGPGGYAVGVAGHARAVTVLQEGAKRLLGDNPTPGEFVLRVRATLEDHGFVPGVPNGVGPQVWGQSLMLASPLGLWTFDEAFFWWRVPPGLLVADGSGRDFALGASYLSNTSEDPAWRVTVAVEAANAFDEASGMGVFMRHLSPDLVAKPTKKPARKRRVAP
jgi:hypothetical protein